MNVLKSASRIVFILLTIALIILTFLRIVDAKDFIALTGMAFVHFFKVSNGQNIKNETSNLG